MCCTIEPKLITITPCLFSLNRASTFEPKLFAGRADNPGTARKYGKAASGTPIWWSISVKINSDFLTSSFHDDISGAYCWRRVVLRGPGISMDVSAIIKETKFVILPVKVDSSAIGYHPRIRQKEG